MKVTIAALADAANVSKENKLNLTGIYDTLRVMGDFPHTQPQLVFAFQILGEYVDANRTFHIEVSIVDEDERTLWSAKGEATSGRAEPGAFGHVSQIIQLRGITFQKPGRFRFRIKVDDQHPPHDVVFQVQRIEGPPGSSPAS